MLKLFIEKKEFWDDESQVFVTAPEVEREFTFEHSLASISKWEEKWCIPYLSDTPKTEEQALDYIRCMCTEEIDDTYLAVINAYYLEEINNYINAPMTATWFTDKSKGSAKKSIITNEIIYYWMFAQQIPKECEHWHFNKLMTLIRVFNEKNGDPKKMSKREIYEQNHALNQARKAKLKGAH